MARRSSVPALPQKRNQRKDAAVVRRANQTPEHAYSEGEANDCMIAEPLEDFFPEPPSFDLPPIRSDITRKEIID